jgi:hypothetical protein
MNMQEKVISDSLQRDISCGIIFAKTSFYLRFQVLAAANMNMAVFWVVAPCILAEIHRHFRDSSCLHQGDDDEGRKHL